MSDMYNKQNPSPQTGSTSTGAGGQQQQFRDTSSPGQQSGSSGSMGQQSGRGMGSAGEASAGGRDLKDRASDLASSAARDIKDRASGLADTAKNMASGAGEKLLGAVEEQKKAGAQQVRGIAQAVRTAADGLEGEIPQAAEYVRRAAQQIESISDALERRDVGELVGQFQDFARRHPTAFLGATVIAGFALVRFLKTSGGRSSSSGQYAGGYGESERYGSSGAGYGASDNRYGGGMQSPSSTAQRGGASYTGGSTGGTSPQGSAAAQQGARRICVPGSSRACSTSADHGSRPSASSRTSPIPALW